MLLIEGAVPGHNGAYVVVRPAIKKQLPDNWPPKKAAAEEAAAE